MHMLGFICVSGLLAAAEPAAPPDSDAFDMNMCQRGVKTAFSSVTPVKAQGLDLESSFHIWGAESFGMNQYGVLYTGAIDGHCYGILPNRDEAWQYVPVLSDRGRVGGSIVVETKTTQHDPKSIRFVDRVIFVSFQTGLIEVNVTWEMMENNPCMSTNGFPLNCMENIKFIEVSDAQVLLEELDGKPLTMPNAIEVFSYPGEEGMFGALVTSSADLEFNKIALSILRTATGRLIYIPDLRKPEQAVVLLENLGLANGISCRGPSADFVLDCWLAETAIIGRVKQISLKIDENDGSAQILKITDHYVGPVMVDNIHWMNLNVTDPVQDRTHLTLAFNHQMSPFMAKTLLKILPLPPWFTDGVLSVMDKYFNLMDNLMNAMPKYPGLGIWDVDNSCLELVANPNGESQIGNMASFSTGRLIDVDTSQPGNSIFTFVLGNWGTVPLSRAKVQIEDGDVEEAIDSFLRQQEL